MLPLAKTGRLQPRAQLTCQPCKATPNVRYARVISRTEAYTRPTGYGRRSAGRIAVWIGHYYAE
jgi:hypothetical protein